MIHSVENLHRFGIKVFLSESPDPDLHAFVPMFHRWIQTHAVDGLLIDVADYTHLKDGPQVLLAGHEGNYVIDCSEGRTGLYYYRKTPTGGSLLDRLVTSCQTVLRASVLLEVDDSLGTRYCFRGDEIQFIANDRLIAPSTQKTIAELQPTLDELLKILFHENAIGVSSDTGPGERLRLNLRSKHNGPIRDLLTRIS